METGSMIPSTPVQQFVDGEIVQIDLSERSAGRTIVLVALVGAFTPPCSDDHVPGYIQNLARLKAEGVDEVIILVPNDFFVAKAWADQMDPDGVLTFVADGSLGFTQDADQILDLTELGLGMRTQRYAAVIRDGVVASCAIEPDATAVSVSGAEAVLAGL